jgi:hypothetical protein
MVTGTEFRNGPWQDVEWFVNTTEQHYADKGLGSIWELTRKQIVAKRGWGPTEYLYAGHFEGILEELGIYYIPETLPPGPGILFPQRDYHERLNHGKLNPYYDLVLSGGSAKYGFLGQKPDRGPSWFGDTDRTLTNIARFRSVVLVEGAYDLLACRLLFPDCPVLTTGTKSVNVSHIQYLRILGVKDVHLLFDQDPPKEGRTEGAGKQAMNIIKNTWGPLTGIKFHVRVCPEKDAAACLGNRRAAGDLKYRLEQIFGQ